MDDFVVNVRQIGNYPDVSTVLPSDLLLIQRGLGGPYYAPSLLQAVQGALDQGGPLGIDLPPPVDAQPSSLFVQWLSTIQGGGLLWNAYASSTGLKNWTPGLSAQLRWDGAGWSFVSGSAPNAWAPAAQITANGHMYLCDTLTVNRPPTGGNEVATYDWVCSGFN